MEIKYFILPKSITILANGKSYHVSSDNQRYKESVSLIKEGRVEEVLKAIDPFFGMNDFCLENGLVKYKNEYLPSILGDQFLKFKMESVSFLSLANLWLNLKNRSDFSSAKERIIEMLSLNGYPLTEDGFFIAFEGYDKKWYEKSLNNDNSIPFYSYGSVSLKDLYEDFKNKKMLSEIIEKHFGFYTKKLNKLVLEGSLNKTRLKIEDDLFKIAIIFKDILSKENLVNFIEKYLKESNRVFQNLSGNDCLGLNEIFKNFSEKKVLNLISKETNQNYSQLIRGYFHLKSLNQNSIERITEFSTLNQMIEFISLEIKRSNRPKSFNLYIENSFPHVKNINDLKINKDLRLIFPKTSDDLHDWSDLMSNCIRGYGNSVLNGQCLVVAVLEHNKMIYNIEIVNFRINQFKKRSNGKVSENEKKPVIDFLLKNGLVKNFDTQES